MSFHDMVHPLPAAGFTLSLAVSLSNCRNVAVFGPHPAINASISCSVGMKGIFLVTLQIGGYQFLPSILRNNVYAEMYRHGL